MLLSALLLSILLVVILAGYLKIIGATPKLWLIVGSAFLVRVGFVVINSFLRLFTPADESGYDTSLQYVSQQWRDGIIHAPLTVSSGPGLDGTFIEVYTLVLGPVYAIFGEYALLGRIGMAFFGTLVVINTYLIGHQVYSHRAGVYAAVIAAIFPYWIYLSGILYRDMMVVFFFTMMFYGVVRWQRDTQDWFALGIAILSSSFAIGLRQVNIIAVGAMVAAIFYTRTDGGSQKTIQVSVVVIGSSVLMIALFGDVISVEGLANRRLWLARESGGSYLTEYAYESVLEMVLFLPIGALYFTFVPFPWQTPNLLAEIALGQNLLLWYPVALLSVVGMRDVFSVKQGHRRMFPLIAFATAGLIGYGLVEGNIGPAMRHRTQFQFAFVVFTGIALSNRIHVENTNPSRIN